MKNTDIIMINATGTNGADKRKTSTVTRSFDGSGQHLDDAGQPKSGSPERLDGLPTGKVTIPTFPQAAFAAAQAKGGAGLGEVKDILAAYQEQVQSAEKLGGGDESVAIVRAVLAYLTKFHEFRQEDGNWFVLKEDAIDLTTQALHDGRTLYMVAATAVFG